MIKGEAKMVKLQHVIKKSYKDLRPIQIYSKEYIHEHKHCGLLLDMGAGKTIAVLTAIDDLIYEFLEFDEGAVLVIAPPRVAKFTWPNEVMEWDHVDYLKVISITGNEKQRLELFNKKAHIYTISNSLVKWLSEQPTIYKRFKVLIIDELSAFKSSKSIRFKAMRKMRRHFDRIIGLTGTPIPNGYLDLWAQLFILDGGKSLFATKTDYIRSYFDIKQEYREAYPTYELKEGAEDLIKEKLATCCISMSASDYADMPDLVINTIMLEMPAAIRLQYNTFEEEKIMEFEYNTVTAVNAGVLANKLLQFCNGAVYGLVEQEESDELLKTTTEIHDLKLDALAELLEETDIKPVIIVYQFKHDKIRIENRFKHIKFRSIETQKDLDDWNRGYIKALLIHPKSIGHGLNLQRGGNIIIWYGLPWSLELYQQVIRRLQRPGQLEAFVAMYILLIKNGYDSKVLNVLTKKDSTQTDLVDSLKVRIEQIKNKLKLVNDANASRIY